jgi:signal transduction histidine kinase
MGTGAAQRLGPSPEVDAATAGSRVNRRAHALASSASRGLGWRRRPRLAVGVAAVVAVAVLAVFAFALVDSQASSRHESEQRFGAQATITASLTNAILGTLESSSAAQAAQHLSGAVSSRTLTSLARRSGDSFAIVASADGSVIAASTGAPALSDPELARTLQVAERGGFWFSDALPGTGSGPLLAVGIPFRAGGAGRLELVGLPLATLYGFFSNYLHGALPQATTHGFIVDSAGRTLGSSVSTGKPAQRVSSSLWTVLRHNQPGSYHATTGQRYVATAPVRSSGWRVAVTESVSDLYTALAGSQRWLLWAVLAAFALVALCGLGLLYRTLSSAAMISSQSRELADSNAALRESNAELDAFSYSVSHDLRAPLRAIDGFSQILMREHSDQLPAEGQRYVGIVRRNALEMGALIDGLLAFSRLGQQQLQKRPVDVESLCREVADELRATPDGEAAVISVGSLPPEEADPALLRQVFVNLVSNALKYSRGREPAQVEIGALEHECETTYFVRDNGTGFDMRYVDKLFKVFQRLHRAEEYEGTGIGLALVARIVKRHGGRVWAEGVPDEGATFFFTLDGGA